MKKIFLLIFLLILVGVGFFSKQILGTIDFYQYQNDNAEMFAKANINWKEIPFSSISNSSLTSEVLTFDEFQFPVPFEANISEGADASFALGSTESISIARSSAAADLFVDHEFSDEDKKTTCHFLTQTSGRGACNSNYDLYRAFLELNETDIHAFASLSDKATYNRLMKIRFEYLPSNTVSGFETSHLRGFIFTLHSHHFIAHLFDKNDQMYVLEFTNLDKSVVAFVLSNLTLAK